MLIQCLCTVALTGLADWSAFQSWFCRPFEVTTEIVRPCIALDGRYGSDTVWHKCLTAQNFNECSLPVKHALIIYFYYYMHLLPFH